MLQVNADYRMTGTRQELREKVSSDLEIDGPGLYLSDTDTVLVLRNDRRHSWNQGDKYDRENAAYVAYFYNCRFDETIFSQIATAPVRSDKRK